MGTNYLPSSQQEEAIGHTGAAPLFCYNIFVKLQVVDRAQAVLRAQQSGQ